MGSLLGYLSAGTALFLNDRYRHDLSDISWFDRVYPPNWPAYREARGRSYIQNARRSLDEQNFSAAFHQLRAGLARYPRDRDGRLLMGQMFVATGRDDLAQKVLVDGLEFHSADLDYLRDTVTFLSRRQNDQEVIRIAHQILPQLDAVSPASRFLAVSLANSLYFRGRFDQAEDVLSSYDLADTPDGRLLVAKIEWDRGFPELALALIERLADEFPANGQIYRTQVRWLVSQGQTDSARRASLLRRLKFPEQAQPRIDLLYAYEETNDHDAVDSEARALLREFGDQYPVILQLGDFAANQGRPALARQVLEHCRVLDMPIEGASLMLVEALIVDARYREALGIARDTLDSHPDWEDSLAPIFNGLRAICYFALGEREEANLFLNSYLSLDGVRAENLVAVAERLIAVGADREARIVLNHAVSTDPLNQPALARLIKFDLGASDAPDLPANIAKLLDMRRASPELLRHAYDRLGEDRYVFVENRNDLLDRLLDSLRGKARTDLAARG